MFSVVLLEESVFDGFVDSEFEDVVVVDLVSDGLALHSPANT